MSLSPSHRNPEHDIQLESCDMCGRLVDNRELRTYDVQGLRGFAICGLHKFTGPGPEDLRRFSIPTPPSVEREQPIGADFWWLDLFEPLAVDSETLLDIDGAPTQFSVEAG